MRPLKLAVLLLLVASGVWAILQNHGRVLVDDQQLAASLPYAAAASRERARWQQSPPSPPTGKVALPPDFPRFRTTGRLPEGARVFLNRTFGGASYAFAIDGAGRVLYHARHDRRFTMDFKPHRLPDGRRFHSYFLNEEAGSAEAVFPGFVRLLDEQFREIQEIRLLPFGGRPARPTENHDFVMLDEGHYLLTSYEEETVDLPERRQARVLAGVVQEVVDGKAVWEWRSTDHPRLYADSVEGNLYHAGVSSYAHLNSVAVDPKDGHLLLSFRNLDAVLKVHRQTGEILWTLGGRSDDFGLTEQQKFSRQHSASRTPEGRILLFDNGVAANRSRVMEYDLDEDRRVLREEREIFARQPASTLMGNVQYVARDTYLVGWGSREGDGRGEPDVSLLQGGKEVWTLDFTTPATSSYRAFLDLP